MRKLIFTLLLCAPVLTVFAQKIKWERTVLNFGTVRDWNSPAASFVFKNTGNKKLMFLPQKHDRSVQVRYPNRSVMPGEEGEITVLYYTSETGSFSKTVEVFTNVSNWPEKLTVKGNIKSIYSNALTACPSFRDDPSHIKHYNVVVVVDRATAEPVTGAKIELFEQKKRRSVSTTSQKGRTTTKIGQGRYRAVVTKSGYRQAEQQLIFDSRTALHIIYLDRIDTEDEPEIAEVSRDRWADPEPAIRSDLARSEETDHLEQDDAEGLGISTNDQWQENKAADQRSYPVPKETEQNNETFDLGVSTNDQWEDADVQKPENQIEESVLKTEKEADDHDSPIVEEAPGPEVSSVPDRSSEVENDRTSEVENAVEAALAAAQNPVNERVQPAESDKFTEAEFVPNNVLLLLDVSRSMKDDDKIGKLKLAIRKLVLMLRKVDVLTVIAYNSTSWEVLPPTAVEDHAYIIERIDSLQPSGYTNGVKGMESAYLSLDQQLIRGGNNQLIIATDGKFNSSKFSDKEAMQLAKDHADHGILLSVIGFGEDREAARMMKRIANAGKGSFMQIMGDEDPTLMLVDEIRLRSKK